MVKPHTIGNIWGMLNVPEYKQNWEKKLEMVYET